MKITEKKLRSIIREELIKLSESPHDYMSQGNPPPQKDSNWFNFATEMDVGVGDLDRVAKVLGYANFLDMDASISPSALADRSTDRFIDAIQSYSRTAEDMSKHQILTAAGASGGAY